MRYVKYIMAALGVLGAILALSYDIMGVGVHGVIVLIGALLPAALVGVGQVTKQGFPRSFAVISLIGLLLVSMKTSDGDPLQNVMMGAFFALILAIVRIIKLEPPTAP